MKLHLVDLSAAVVDALRWSFAEHSEVAVLQGNLLEVARHAAVSPANSYGFMDGGIDAAYQQFFGPAVARHVRDVVLARPEGHLPVGAAVAVPTGHERIPYLILAPTMLMPEAVPASNAYRALRAVLRIVDADPDLDGDIYCPGLCTLVGGVDPVAAADEMAEAYASWKAG